MNTAGGISVRIKAKINDLARWLFSTSIDYDSMTQIPIDPINLESILFPLQLMSAPKEDAKAESAPERKSSDHKTLSFMARHSSELLLTAPHYGVNLFHSLKKRKTTVVRKLQWMDTLSRSSLSFGIFMTRFMSRFEVRIRKLKSERAELLLCNRNKKNILMQLNCV